ncbi:hypothetical protein TraAM80_02026 [Trypanosoma rangeli]|uniref:Uncharacterized protein n=1 Tax=Trypanosoma rangeli TaxID=5698 RepID=A0A422NW46_TRYRA|nr:uncharacterized protein TraAM80_02026 [Trypanosoma rangeli]RNF09671.1 hypothetical protein TraAM80_02026 [Trypanosoma rangeli]|eukprot:RNF09671.1 hypothetical protein TraAM80_02026 [Trypanosoma rangeli]
MLRVRLHGTDGRARAAGAWRRGERRRTAGVCVGRKAARGAGWRVRAAEGEISIVITCLFCFVLLLVVLRAFVRAMGTHAWVCSRGACRHLRLGGRGVNEE